VDLLRPAHSREFTSGSGQPGGVVRRGTATRRRPEHPDLSPPTASTSIIEEAVLPDQNFTVHVDPDDLARQDLAAGVPAAPVTGSAPGARSEATAKHGARDERLAARQRSERDRSGRASGAGSSRSYAFRRS
jgi:hypothetical protein